MADGVGIVIPAYDVDPDRLGSYIESLASSLEPDRIHVEADEPSEPVLRRLERTSASVSVVERRRGKGTAITAGFDRLDTAVLAFVDADGSTPPSSLERILDPVLEGSADLTVGSRRHPDSQVPVHQSRVRRRLGDLLVVVAREVLPVALFDYQCGAKAIRRETWERVRGEITSPGFAWDIELICLVDEVGGTVREIPIRWEDRPGSTVPPIRSGLGFGRTLLRTWHRGKLRRGSRVHGWFDRTKRAAPLVERTDLHGRDPD